MSEHTGPSRIELARGAAPTPAAAYAKAHPEGSDSMATLNEKTWTPPLWVWVVIVALIVALIAAR